MILVSLLEFKILNLIHIVDDILEDDKAVMMQ